ncbi:CAAX protease self-immunity-domain-containing protein [Delphinella strobiligena]|nr:CAAX protease self-immunity-domain-containing protein [Delphinella strobiligena]
MAAKSEDGSSRLLNNPYPTNELPPISAAAAAGLTVLYTIFYIAPFYISPTLRSTTLSNRNNPAVIKARIRAVGLTCLLCTAINVLVFIKHSSTPQDILRLFGVYPVHLLDTARCILLVAILFVGPLFEAGIVEGYWRYWPSWSYIKDTVYDDWQGWRNIVIGPASEELVFRSLAIPLFLLAKSSPVYITFVSPLIFGLAHLHHLHEFIISQQKLHTSYIKTALTPGILIPGLIRVTFMFTYTSLFGFFVAFVYLRTGNLWSCIAAHAFCNAIGLPRFFGRLGKGLDKAAARDGDASIQGVADEIKAGRDDEDLGIEWTVVYYILLCVGAYAFKRLLWPLTDSDMALAVF